MNNALWKYENIKGFVQSVPEGKKVLVGGCFDILHYGHVQFLTEAKKKGDLLIVALESDVFIEKAKNRKPVHTQLERAHVLASLRVVDYVILLPLMQRDGDYEVLVRHVAPHVIAVTENDPHIEKKRQHAQKVQATIEPVTPRLSTFSSRFIAHNENFYRD